MSFLPHFGLVQRSGGFLSAPDLRGFGQGARLTASFNPDRFHPDLFKALNLQAPNRMDSWTTSRQAEFLAGRLLAAIGQGALGLSSGQVLVGPDRAPRWPRSVTGSISHANRHCACIVLPRGNGNPGIDVETVALESKLKALQAKAMTVGERARLTSAPDPALFSTLIFSAKETLFKALYPTVQRFFGFHCAELASAPGTAHLTLALTEMLHPDLPRGLCFDVAYEVKDETVLTWMVHETG
ncbi:4'-phosphopantetheinyl transferase superfamily protein [Primorskyibacter aestuariivivens]|uniref:4'-phosphopantetheinyl transferase family protein n=1 Tax=Primorskyibacter aestuariivivens TaxID=1888912 RepID=UPI00230103D5|nr:4'-phosphopantetheinyl transferase superfamily protein [Primorskyibacter aestuariivivens]MDA7429476.1 4'-phosphopantetheinyl transferase superfamily protein [Primorskyibacter aestuariivivens]